MQQILEGYAIKFGDDIDTDAIIPGRYLHSFRGEELAPHVMEGADPEFSARRKRPTILIAGANFGCGSARENAPIALKAADVIAVVARSFSRAFFRNAINIALPIFELEEIDDIEDHDFLTIDVSTSLIRNGRSKKEYKAAPFPEAVKEIIQAGGLVEFTRARLAQKRKLS
jgi:3-isopropylmalate/(R)-2-methylmalate dehydratase small subunit